MYRRWHLDVSWIGGTPKSSILIGFSIINHLFCGTPISGNPHLLWWKLMENNVRDFETLQGIWSASDLQVVAANWDRHEAKVPASLYEKGEPGHLDVAIWNDWYIFVSPAHFIMSDLWPSELVLAEHLSGVIPMTIRDCVSLRLSFGWFQMRAPKPCLYLHQKGKMFVRTPINLWLTPHWCHVPPIFPIKLERGPHENGRISQIIPSKNIP